MQEQRLWSCAFLLPGSPLKILPTFTPAPSFSPTSGTQVSILNLWEKVWSSSWTPFALGVKLEQERLRVAFAGDATSFRNWWVFSFCFCSTLYWTKNIPFDILNVIFPVQPYPEPILHLLVPGADQVQPVDRSRFYAIYNCIHWIMFQELMSSKNIWRIQHWRRRRRTEVPNR